MQKKYKIILVIIAGIALVLALLWYYQQQGLLKVFPTAEDRLIKKLTVIDRSKFKSPEGLSEEKLQEAISRLEQQRDKILENPKDSQAWFDFAHTKEFLNDHAGAAAAWEKSFELQPYNFITSGNLGNVYEYFLKDYPKSEFYYLKSLEVKPDNRSAYDGLADLYRYNWSGKADLLEPLLLAAIEKDPTNNVAYYATLVEFFASSNNWDKARAYLENVVKLNSEKAKELLEAYPALK